MIKNRIVNNLLIKLNQTEDNIYLSNFKIKLTPDKIE